ncbi:hypothetical protein F2P56_021639 [Juglans regia]|uniref:Molybdopterin oxidoreductase domain-containing protein n=1 Tax=Juglans regia TaxID=51240 RepID=A0A833UIG5_JUGRE|nr:hypothetical protein F2P56_021639 [Juglans regia]
MQICNQRHLMRSSIAGFEQADVFLSVGTQPRVEAAMVNARIRKTVCATQAKVEVTLALQLISTMITSILAQTLKTLVEVFLRGRTWMPFSLLFHHCKTFQRCQT